MKEKRELLIFRSLFIPPNTYTLFFSYTEYAFDNPHPSILSTSPSSITPTLSFFNLGLFSVRLLVSMSRWDFEEERVEGSEEERGEGGRNLCWDFLILNHLFCWRQKNSLWIFSSHYKYFVLIKCEKRVSPMNGKIWFFIFAFHFFPKTSFLWIFPQVVVTPIYYSLTIFLSLLWFFLILILILSFF